MLGVKLFLVVLTVNQRVGFSVSKPTKRPPIVVGMGLSKGKRNVTLGQMLLLDVLSASLIRNIPVTIMVITLINLKLLSVSFVGMGLLKEEKNVILVRS